MHGFDGPALGLGAAREAKAAHYEGVVKSIQLVLEGETNWVAAMATVACLLHEAFEYYHWTGFYQACDSEGGSEPVLVIGPYQGHLGCLRIPHSRGVCGAAAREGSTQLVPDVSRFPGYIACASSTRSEIVVPVFAPGRGGDGSGEDDGGGGGSGPRRLLAVLDVDSDDPAAFDEVDQQHLERLCGWLGEQGFR